jgi:hypothetical protein
MTSNALRIAIGLMLMAAASSLGQTTNNPNSGTTSGTPSGFGGGVPGSLAGGIGSSFGNATSTGGGLGAADYTNGRLGTTPRFLRANRAPNSFVGADRAEFRGFIGRGTSTTATGAGAFANPANPLAPGVTTPLTAGAPGLANASAVTAVARVTAINRVRVPTAATLPKEPPLVIGFAVSPTTDFDRRQQLVNHWVRTPALVDAGQVEIVVRERVAVLTGQVPTQAARRLAELTIAMEPGVDTVENQLVVTRP